MKKKLSFLILGFILSLGITPNIHANNSDYNTYTNNYYESTVNNNEFDEEDYKNITKKIVSEYQDELDRLGMEVIIPEEFDTKTRRSVEEYEIYCREALERNIHETKKAIAIYESDGSKWEDIEWIPCKFSDLENQSESIELHHNLMESFKDDTMKYINYPDYYGGSYLNYNSELVILIKGDINNYKNNFYQGISNENIIFEECNYSYNELKQLMNSLNDIKLDIDKKYDYLDTSNFTNYSLMDEQNCIIVELKEYNDETIKLFKEQISDSPAIKFTKFTGFAEDDSYVKPGDKIVTK